MSDKKHEKYTWINENGFTLCCGNDTVKTVDIFSLVVFDENIEKIIEECVRYNELMLKKYSNTITNEDRNSTVYKKYANKIDFQNNNYVLGSVYTKRSKEKKELK